MKIEGDDHESATTHSCRPERSCAHHALAQGGHHRRSARRWRARAGPGQRQDRCLDGHAFGALLRSPDGSRQGTCQGARLRGHRHRCPRQDDQADSRHRRPRHARRQAPDRQPGRRGRAGQRGQFGHRARRQGRGHGQHLEPEGQLRDAGAVVEQRQWRPRRRLGRRSGRRQAGPDRAPVGHQGQPGRPGTASRRAGRDHGGAAAQVRPCRRERRGSGLGQLERRRRLEGDGRPAGRPQGLQRRAGRERQHAAGRAPGAGKRQAEQRDARCSGRRPEGSARADQGRQIRRHRVERPGDGCEDPRWISASRRSRATRRTFPSRCSPSPPPSPRATSTSTTTRRPCSDRGRRRPRRPDGNDPPDGRQAAAHAGRREQELRRRPCAARRRLRGSRRRGARAGRRERRRQVDGHEGHRRQPHTERRNHPSRRRADALPHAARCAGSRHCADPPGDRAGAGPDGGRERDDLPPAGRHPLGCHVPRGLGVDQGPWLRHRPERSGLLAVGRASPDRRDREGAEPAGQAAGSRRADRLACAQRRQPSARHRARPAQARCRHRLHLAPPARGVRDRRPHHRAERRREGCHRHAAGSRHGRADPADGRASACGTVPAPRRRDDRQGRAQGLRPRPSWRGRRRFSRGACRRGRRHRWP